MTIYFQISNYNGRICGSWDHSPSKKERSAEFYKDLQMNEPKVVPNPEYHSVLYSIDTP